MIGDATPPTVEPLPVPIGFTLSGDWRMVAADASGRFAAEHPDTEHGFAATLHAVPVRLTTPAPLSTFAAALTVDTHRHAYVGWVVENATVDGAAVPGHALSLGLVRWQRDRPLDLVQRNVFLAPAVTAPHGVTAVATRLVFTATARQFATLAGDYAAFLSSLDTTDRAALTIAAIN